MGSCFQGCGLDEQNITSHVSLFFLRFPQVTHGTQESTEVTVVVIVIFAIIFHNDRVVKIK